VAGASEIRAGAAFVEIFAKDSRLVKGLAAAKAKLEAFGKEVAAIGRRIATVGLAGLAGAVAAGKTFADMGSELYRLSQRTGIAVESLSLLKAAASEVGADSLETGLKKMQKAIFGLATGVPETVLTFQRLHLQLADLAGLSADQQLVKIAGAFERIHDPAIRSALAMEVFGKSGTDLLPLIGQGAAELQRRMARAAAEGMVWSQAEAESAEKLKEAWTSLSESTMRALAAIGAAFAPALKATAKQLADIAQRATRWAKENQGLIASFMQIAKITVAVGAGIYLVGKAIMFAGAAFGALRTGAMVIHSVLTGVVAVVSALVGPVGLVIAGLTALGAVFVLTSEGGREALVKLGGAFGQLKEIAGDAIGGIKDALMAGDIQLAAKIMWAALKLAWNTGVNALMNVWREFRDWFVDLYWDMVTAAAKALTWLWGKIRQGWIETRDAAKDLWTYLFGGKDWAKDIVDREQARRKDKAAIDNETSAIRKGLDADRQRDSDRMKSAREAAGKQDESELASLRAEFDALRNQAAEAKKKKLEAGTPEFYAAHKNQPNADELLDLAEKKASVHGTFNASVADRIGIKDPIPKQQLNMLQRLDENTKRLILEFQRANATFT
jgi:hypothetical protein